MRSHHPSLLFAGVAALLLSGAPAQAAAGSPPASPGPVLATDGQTREIALVTGDSVLVAPDGRTGFLPGPGREGVTHVTYVEGGDRYVVPTDALRLLDEGVVDKRLFDVTDLIADGFADTGALPVIVRDEPGAFDAMSASGKLWDRVADGRVDRLWLDGKAHFTLAESVPQIGAPAAWEAGYTGEGVTVAILDGGYDPTHPDLSGRVKGAKDFTGTSPEVLDGYGHGTHVASTVAGSGAASSGRYKGVAPDADLLIGKVCTDAGECPETAIIEGLQWAADNGAAVANMSLGGGPSDGTDPLSLAVNEITESSGMLVVISAGNDGCATCVSAPGTADRALTVGSVTKQDALSEFSSQGPRYGDGAVKPDITAPGSSITAARAKGTAMGTPVDANYTTADGTSMAAPHTTGAVALLKQAHPDWTADRLKAALMGASKGLDGLSVFQQGAGRVDAKAVSATVTPVAGSVSFGTFEYPYAQDPAAREVTYRNDSGADVELTLTLAGDAMFTVGSPKVTVPAHGTATVKVSAKVTGGTAGAYGSFLTATADGVSVRTALGAVLEPEVYDLNINVTTRAGGPIAPDMFGGRLVFVVGLDARSWDIVDLDENGKGTIRVAPGRYQVLGAVREGGDSPSMTDFADDVTIAGADVDFAMDLRPGELIDVAVDAADAVHAATMEMVTSKSAAGEHLFGFNQLAWNGTPSYSVPNADPGSVVDLVHAVTLGSPKGAAAPYSYSLFFTRTGDMPGRTTFTAHNGELAREDAVYHSQGVATTGRRVDWVWGEEIFYSIDEPDITVPSRRTEYFTPATWTGTFQLGEKPSRYEFAQYDPVRTAGTVKSVVWGQAPLGVGPVGASRTGDEIWLLPAMYDGSNPELRIMDAKGDTVSGSSSLTFGGEEIPLDSGGPCWRVGPLPAGASGTFTFSCDTTRVNDYSVIGTASSAKWTFHSEPPSGEFALLPILNVRVGSECVVNGYAPAKKVQVVNLDVSRTDEVADVRTRKLTFEVSYDDGKTWKSVPLLRNGDNATALLAHPKGAKFVSTRITAVDGDGNSVTQKTIRSYGLK
ncbi:S8 family peptidase [Phytomonospora endophytica]|uniref:Subtilisin family serine protease n=1 Tax=Phytomonospora endophytica TaxID=714109 RepID=A0A841F7P7_9ACTN|nr:S8 family serine peptidase [Phytomonospora endophytica]MBB6032236.1 subtilisin family serine protease [Phytomonospora endophytica]GIG68585.1 serine protease [Phytomonospora endophytica]